ncbi:MAG: acyltransferase [Patescibacteria group bacterium]
MNTSHKGEVQRVVELDILRGIGIFSVLLIHSTVLYTSNPIAFFLWDINQFAVQLLVFCASYIYFIREKTIETFSFLQYFKKRILRLVQPYYIFLAAYFLVLFIFQKSIFSKPYFILQSTLITGGVDINWLVLLMLQFALLFPVLSFLKQKFKLGFYFLLAASIASAIWLLFHKIPVHFKVVMWLPWISVAFYSLLFVKFKNNIRFLTASFAVMLVLFVGLHILQSNLGHSTKMYDNKYPPNLYFLVYGMMVIPFLLILNHIGLFRNIYMQQFLTFLSKNSYSLFFLHFLVLFFLQRLEIHKKLEWLGFFGLVLVVSVTAQFLINKAFLQLVGTKNAKSL